MKLSDVVTQLQLVIPKYTDYFSETLEINSPIVVSGGVAIIETLTNHSLVTGSAVAIVDVSQDTLIQSVLKDGLTYSFSTTPSHDLTYGYEGYETVKLNGFTNSDWNDNFDLISVGSKNDFSIQSVLSIPTLNGNEYLSEIRIDGINGRHSVTVIDETHFSITGVFNDGTYNGGKVKKSVRVAGSVSIERAIEQYSKQNVSDLWAFVTMSKSVASKNRDAYNDAVASFVKGEDIRMRMIDGFSVYLVKNVKNDIAAVNAMDICRHELFSPILKSLYGAKFSTGLTEESEFISILTGHSKVIYERSIFVYKYDFEFIYDLVESDSVEESDTRAFNQVGYSHNVGNSDTENSTFNILLP